MHKPGFDAVWSRIRDTTGTVTAEFVILIPVICFLLGFCVLTLQAQFVHQRVLSATTQAHRVLQISGASTAQQQITSDLAGQGMAVDIRIETNTPITCLYVTASTKLLHLIPVTSSAKTCAWR